MNKYLKVFALSSTLLGAISISAINPNNQSDGELNNVYENIEKMQESVPKLSRIKFNLDVNAVQDENVKFISTDDTGTETNLTNQETITYLNQTLEQANLEYEQLKQTLMTAIQDTMEHLEQYKNGESELTNEQKIYIKEHANSIKYLAETLEDLSEDVICCIDGCENCDDEEEFSQATSKYLATINQLEQRIDTLQRSLYSLHFINSISNPSFYAGYGYSPNFIMYGAHHNKPEVKDESASEDNANNNGNYLNEDDEQNTSDEQQNGETASDNSNDSSNSVSPNDNSMPDNTVLEVENSGANNNTDNTEEKPTTFGLKSNIDTYAPTKRNIDTFFNTALANKEYNNMYGNGYNPYGYGGGYGYGMPYAPYYGNPYGMSGINSNMINRATLENQQNVTPANSEVSDNQIENNITENNEKPRKIRIKRAKNIDTYADVTVKSNINTMGESKISKFFKQKFNNLRNKVRKQTNDSQNSNQPNQAQDIAKQPSVNTFDVNDNINQDIDLSEISKTSENNASEQSIINPNNNISEDTNMIDSNTQSDLNLTEQQEIKAK